jgi:hypothetical protein
MATKLDARLRPRQLLGLFSWAAFILFCTTQHGIVNENQSNLGITFALLKSVAMPDLKDL